MNRKMKFLIVLTFLVCLLFTLSLSTNAKGIGEVDKKYYGTDIAHYSGKIDWLQLKKTKYSDFIYIKASEGMKTNDSMLSENVEGAKRVKIPYSFYHYFHCYGVESAKAQARRFYDKIKDFDYSLIPVVDIEETDSCEKSEIKTELREFINEFYELSGRKPMIYTYYYFANRFLDDDFSDCKLWIARYNSAVGILQGFNDYSVWQFSGDKQKILGIDNFADLDVADESIFLKSESESDNKNDRQIKTNSRAGKRFDVLTKEGTVTGNHFVYKNDNIEIVNVDFKTQIAEIYYPVNDKFVHGYINNDELYFHNIGYRKWKNGRTSEVVYDDKGKAIGKIYPFEKATVLRREKNRTLVLYDTFKGEETKTGFVKYEGLR